MLNNQRIMQLLENLQRTRKIRLHRHNGKRKIAPDVRGFIFQHVKCVIWNCKTLVHLWQEPCLKDSEVSQFGWWRKLEEPPMHLKRIPTSVWRRSCGTPTTGEESCRGRWTASGRRPTSCWRPGTSSSPASSRPSGLSGWPPPASLPGRSGGRGTGSGTRSR